MPGFTEDDRNLAIGALNRLLTAAHLRRVVPPELERAVSSVERSGGLYKPRVAEEDLAPFLVDLHGPELLRERAIRALLVQVISDESLKGLVAYDENARPPRGRKGAEELVVRRNWHPGKSWPRYFVRTLGLPATLAGSADGGERAAYEDIDTWVPLPPLHPFQRELMDDVRSVVSGPTGKNRGILSLPTGAGKTRTVVEALVALLHDENDPQGYILWIAQSDELCEQAVEAFREVWTDHSIRAALAEPGLRQRSLRLFRLWSYRSAPDPTEQGVIIASIQKLDSMCRREDATLSALVNRVLVVVVDEAHHAIAPGYSRVFRALGIGSKTNESERPLLGLTATPYRGSDVENAQLIRRFQGNLIAPNWADPMGRLRDDGILAVMTTTVLKTNLTYQLTTKEQGHVQQFHDLPESALSRIGSDHDRNKLILKHMLDFAPDWPVLFFGCSVNHARAIALLLRRRGRSAAVVTSETPRSLRRGWIDEFRSGELQYLCNYGVLTTGFDAPKVRVVVVARPTASVLLYEQMVGRGMRGPANGGKQECLVVDLVDAIPQFGELMSYQRYSELWTKRPQRAAQCGG
jgi:DNA repair protein RadD